MMRRAAKASRASSAEGSTTYQPRRDCTSTKPRACSCISASRTMVRLTPKFSASCCSPRRSPGASFCARMASTTRAAMVVGVTSVIMAR